MYSTPTQDTMTFRRQGVASLRPGVATPWGFGGPRAPTAWGGGWLRARCYRPALAALLGVRWKPPPPSSRLWGGCRLVFGKFTGFFGGSVSRSSGGALFRALPRAFPRRPFAPIVLRLSGRLRLTTSPLSQGSGSA